MVVAIGAANDFMTQLSKLATTDSHGNKMIFGLKDFKNFAHVAYYFHKGMCVGACPLSVQERTVWSVKVYTWTKIFMEFIIKQPQ